jgi:hypothetical protein
MMQEAQRYREEWQRSQRARLEDGRDADSFVYVHLRADNDQPFYVGIGYKVSRPWDMRHHSRTDWHRNVVSKNGVRTEIVIDSINWEQANFWEVLWIKTLKESGFELVNLTLGGDGVRGFPSANRKSVLCLETGDIFESCESAAKFFGLSNATISSACNLKNRYAKGYHFIFSNSEMPEEKRKIIISEIELKCANRRKKVEANKSYDGVKEGRDNKGRSAAGPMKISRKVLCLDDGKIYQSASEAARIYNVAKSAVIELCLGKNNRKSVGGLKFKYVEDA